jgi:hypothetical protein
MSECSFPAFRGFQSLKIVDIQYFADAYNSDNQIFWFLGYNFCGFHKKYIPPIFRFSMVLLSKYNKILPVVGKIEYLR